MPKVKESCQLNKEDQGLRQRETLLVFHDRKLGDKKLILDWLKAIWPFDRAERTA
jgi:hypothetical protein